MAVVDGVTRRVSQRPPPTAAARRQGVGEHFGQLSSSLDGFRLVDLEVRQVVQARFLGGLGVEDDVDFYMTLCPTNEPLPGGADETNLERQRFGIVAAREPLGELGNFGAGVAENRLFELV